MRSASSLDELMEKWEEQLKAVGSGVPPAIPLLDLSVYDLQQAALGIDCPYCRTHMRLEAGEVSHVAERLKQDGNKVHDHGLRERVDGLLISSRIIINVLLGGLRRAGVI